MDARSVIAAVRDGQGLSPEAARFVAEGLADGSFEEAQAGAFAMAVLLRGIGGEGRVALTEAMRDSGEVLSWDLPGPVIDKHSTGGVGDCVSLLLAPALAACGCFVPMISGRGLGHTGGTLDKMEAIPGYRTDPGIERMRAVVAEVGCAIVGASTDIAPADRRLYAVRDVTSTVESVDLITASILSKKLAAGLDGLVLDVKVGSGAFLPDVAQARALARALVDTANDAGCRTRALITDMNQSLSRAAGNSLEVIEVMETLTGGSINEALWDVTAALGGEALVIAGLAPDREAGSSMIDRVIEGGAAAEVFGRMVRALGGPGDFVDRYPDRLPSAPVLRPVPAPRDGIVAAVNTRALGEAVVHLGGGRLRAGDKVNLSVGLEDMARIGQEVEVGEPLAFIHAATPEAAEAAARTIQAAFTVSGGAVDAPPLIYERITP